MAAVTVNQIAQQPSNRGIIITKQIALYVALTIFGLGFGRRTWNRRLRRLPG